MNTRSGIYEIKNTVTGDRYVGSTNNFRDRWKSHRYYLRHGKYKTSHFQHAWNKYGEDAFEFNVIVEIPSPSLLQIEQVFLNEEIGEYNSCPVVGDTNKGRTRSEAERRAISERMMGNKYSLGFYPSKETREKMSRSRMGNKNSLGIKQSVETREKKRQAVAGEKHPNFGKHLSEETRQRISSSLKLRAARLKMEESRNE